MSDIKNDYACPECQGRGDVSCPTCEQATECADCAGSGLNAAKIDPDAFRDACAERLRIASWDWVEGNVVLGRRSKAVTVAYADFPPRPPLSRAERGES